MSEVRQLASKRRVPLPWPASFLKVCEVLGLEAPAISEGLCFTLSRCKEGTEIGLQQGSLWWNLSCQINTYPPSFKDARKWVAAYAARYGYTAREVPRRGPR
jgi:hypothetical protein